MRRTRVAELKIYTCVCVKCKTRYKTTKELDLDGKGRCVACQKIREQEIETILRMTPKSVQERALSLLEQPYIEYNGIKFYPL